MLSDAQKIKTLEDQKQFEIEIDLNSIEDPLLLKFLKNRLSPKYSAAGDLFIINVAGVETKLVDYNTKYKNMLSMCTSHYVETFDTCNYGPYSYRIDRTKFKVFRNTLMD